MHIGDLGVYEHCGRFLEQLQGGMRRVFVVIATGRASSVTEEGKLKVRWGSQNLGYGMPCGSRSVSLPA